MQIKSIELRPIDMDNGDKSCTYEALPNARVADIVCLFVRAVDQQYGPLELYAVQDLLTTLGECLEVAEDDGTAGEFYWHNVTNDFTIIVTMCDR